MPRSNDPHFDQAAGDPGVEFFTQPRKMVFHRLTADELEALYEAGNYKTLDISMFAMCVGVFATLLVTLLTVKLDTVFEIAAFIAATCVFALGTIVFGFRARIAWRSARRMLQGIRDSKAQP